MLGVEVPLDYVAWKPMSSKYRVTSWFAWKNIPRVVVASAFQRERGRDTSYQVLASMFPISFSRYISPWELLFSSTKRMKRESIPLAPPYREKAKFVLPVVSYPLCRSWKPPHWS